MARRKATEEPAEARIADYRYNDSKRRNIPPAGLAAQGKVAESNRIEYAYNPHLPPVLRTDPTGSADCLPELLATARTRALTAEEARILAESLRHREPWLEWSGKREKKGFAVEPVALHIHERISAQAITKIAARENVQRDLFADPQLDYHKAVQFYQHDVDWANRMILGDSLQVMASLARREDVAGKVQMIYMDPPYGIKFASNFQPEIGKRDVKDKASDLTREPEMVKAYRDTWTLGVHSYLAYLRDRLILSRELLADRGSIFVQISDENLHRVRMLLDETFGSSNFVAVITVKKTAAQTDQYLPSSCDYLLWYAKDKEQLKFRPLFLDKSEGTALASQYKWAFSTSGELVRQSLLEGRSDLDVFRLCRPDNLTSSHEYSEGKVPVEYRGGYYTPGPRYWTTSPKGFDRLRSAARLTVVGKTLSYLRFLDDYPCAPLLNVWTDTGTGGYGDERYYVVQTTSKIVERCLLMTTDPGDLVLDPTCGSGTTAYVAESWGRRWITIDTSRVALSLARQRLMTASFPFYRVKNNGQEETANPATGFAYKTVPHITLKSIAQNAALDPIFARHNTILDEKLTYLNAALSTVTPELHRKLAEKLANKEKLEGKKSITDADLRRWQLPRDSWQEWEVPFDTDLEWPKPLKDALEAYRAAWRAKMEEVNDCIKKNAAQEDLVDQPEPVKGVVRVSGPFTMEAVMPVAESLDCDTPIGGEPDELATFGAGAGGVCVSPGASDPVNAEAFLDRMLHLLRNDGVRFPNNKSMKFSRLDTYNGDYLHAEGEWANGDGVTRTVAVSFGPQFGPVTAFQVENALPTASRRGFEDLVFAGFSFDAAAQAIIQDDPNPRVRSHLAHIRPDVNMGELLKETPNSQLFTVFGSPRTDITTTKDGQYVVEMQGVDIYNPVENTIIPTNADKVAAWFLDSDYDGQTFCITQAFFPDRTAWDKLAKAMKGVIDEARFAALSGTKSLPFPAGKYKRAAVKVIDPRGNEVLRVHRLGADGVSYV
ncbi:site-specific DNA-methyltransferase [Geomonas paludis]|uniref:site-specific DNA-methyltransferase (adenine-specific) n=1 Tax=Geomonas paludis TaxID=2740185 RepID=A0A6V8MQX1_9BACT|nr:site-specific DNA-methyltransferase [Geomonas paludis]GFO62332.1 hypothetical protein GMPD_02510 [Geomonas paludis]